MSRIIELTLMIYALVIRQRERAAEFINVQHECLCCGEADYRWKMSNAQVRHNSRKVFVC